jgi:hypothetical protein
MTENCAATFSKPGLTFKKEDQPKHLNVGKGIQEREGKSEEEVAWTPQTSLTEEQRQNTLNALKEAKAADTVLSGNSKFMARSSTP